MLSLILATTITLQPADGYVGKMHLVEPLCDFKYSTAVLAPGTKLTVKPYTETYGEGSAVNRYEGMSCGNCYVTKLGTDDGVSWYFECEFKK